MAIDRDAVIQAVVQEYGILLGKDDPILAFLAVHDIVLQQYSEKLREDFELISDQFYSQSKDLAETITGNTVKQINQEGKSLIAGFQEILDAERQIYQKKIQEQVNQGKHYRNQTNIAMWGAVGCSIIAVITTILLVLNLI